MGMTREELIAICERGRTPQSKWRNRDSAAAQRQMGEAWALLSADCDFRIMDQPSDTPCVTDEETIWVEITFHGFDYFEDGEAESDHFYLPTQARLDQRSDRDWY